MSNSSSISYTIKPGSLWRIFHFSELWAFRGLLLTLIARNLRIRYKHTFIGFGWVLLQPALTMLIYTLFFGLMIRIQTHEVPYPLFAYTGIVVWGFVTKTVQECSTALTANHMLIKKVYFPRLLIPLAAGLGNLIDFLVAALLLFFMLWHYAIPITPHVFFAIGFMFMAILCSVSVGIWLGSLDVKYRDIRQAVPLLIQLWMFSSPIIYPASMVPQQFCTFYDLNPMVAVIEGFRWSLLSKTPPPSAFGFCLSLGIIFLLLLSGLMYLGHLERDIADVI